MRGFSGEDRRFKVVQHNPLEVLRCADRRCWKRIRYDNIKGTSQINLNKIPIRASQYFERIVLHYLEASVFSRKAPHAHCRLVASPFISKTTTSALNG
jgi:hypothetical protein